MIDLLPAAGLLRDSAARRMSSAEYRENMKTSYAWIQWSASAHPRNRRFRRLASIGNGRAHRKGWNLTTPHTESDLTPPAPNNGGAMDSARPVEPLGPTAPSRG